MKNKTAYVNGQKITGTLEVGSATYNKIDISRLDVGMGIVSAKIDSGGGVIVPLDSYYSSPVVNTSKLKALGAYEDAIGDLVINASGVQLTLPWNAVVGYDSVNTIEFYVIDRDIWINEMGDISPSVTAPGFNPQGNYVCELVGGLAKSFYEDENQQLQPIAVDVTFHDPTTYSGGYSGRTLLFCTNILAAS